MNMEIDFRIKTLVGLGRALTVLLVVMWLDKPCSEIEVADYTGYTRKTCRKYLHDLHGMGYLTRAWERGGWLTTTTSRQMILGENINVKGKNPEIKGHFYPLPFTTTTTIGREEDDEKEAEVVNEVKGKNGDFKGKNYPLNAELFDALTDAGIMGKVREELAQREELDAGIVAAFQEDLKRRKGESYSTGLLVHVLREYRAGDAVPENHQQDGRSYIGGKYAEFIHH